MKWLLDANLSYRLVRQLADLPIELRHVTRTGLAIPAEDQQIWAWAKANEYLVVTNDDDFYRFAGVWGFPPKVVMLRTGNQSTRALADILRRHLPDIEQLAYSASDGVLELF